MSEKQRINVEIQAQPLATGAPARCSCFALTAETSDRYIHVGVRVAPKIPLSALFVPKALASLAGPGSRSFGETIRTPGAF